MGDIYIDNRGGGGSKGGFVPAVLSLFFPGLGNCSWPHLASDWPFRCGRLPLGNLAGPDYPFVFRLRSLPLNAAAFDNSSQMVC